jgi:hypothetical protein
LPVVTSTDPAPSFDPAISDPAAPPEKLSVGVFGFGARLAVAATVQSVRDAPELSMQETVAFAPEIRFSFGSCAAAVAFASTVW